MKFLFLTLLTIVCICNNLNAQSLNQPVVLPVVVHVVRTDPYSITDAEIIAGIADMTDFFRKSGIYASTTTVDTKIGFCLAKIAPDGGATTGITRTYCDYGKDFNPRLESSRLASANEWDPSHYVNIWLIENMHEEAIAVYECGRWTRVGAGALGGPGGIITPGFGGVIHHEMGHYLNLLHTFGTCKNDNCETDGDQVCDTPPDNSFRSSSCTNPMNSCQTDTLSNYSNGIFLKDVPDDIYNLMDYGGATGSCPGTSTRLTLGQAERMQKFLLNSKASLLDLPEKCSSPCTSGMVADFTKDINQPLPDATINFTNKSTGATGYEWFVDGELKSTATDFSYTFPATGKYKITLHATNNSDACFASYNNNVIVTCGVKARFFTDKEAIASRLTTMKDSVAFTNSSVNATNFAWLISNDVGMAEQVYSTQKDLVYVFPEPGNYFIRLAANNGSCYDTTGIFSFHVQNPDADAVMYYPNSVCIDANTIKVSVCIWNFGFAKIPVGTPITFFDADPRNPGAKKLGTSYYFTNDLNGSGGCYTCIEHTIPGKRIDFASKPIYIAINTEGNKIPIDFSDAVVTEKQYNNNVTTIKVEYPKKNVAICNGETFLGHSVSGVYTDTLTAANNGCLSLQTTALTVFPKYTRKDTVTICYGKNYREHSESGDYIDAFISKNGCDSSFFTHLKVIPLAQKTIDSTICEGHSVFGYTKTGVYKDKFVAYTGCDSTRILRLTVNPKKTTHFTYEICEGDSAFIRGVWKKKAGTYYDTLRTYLGCDSIIESQLLVNPLPKPELGSDRGLCIGESYTLYPGDFQTYLWNNGSTNRELQVNTIGSYSVLVSNIYNCKQKDSINITKIHLLPSNFLPQDTSLCLQNILTLSVPGYKEYLWNTQSKVSFIKVSQTGVYTLQVTDKHDCKGIDSVKVVFINGCIPIQVPNAFTPNDDGLNDVFKPLVTVPLRNYILRVYNRYGQKVYETNDYFKGWDGRFNGKKENPDTYVYTITYIDMDNIFHSLKGTITLLR